MIQIVQIMFLFVSSKLQRLTLKQCRVSFALNTRKCQRRIWVIWRIAKRTWEGHRKLKFTTELFVKKLIFRKVREQISFWEWKTKVIFEDACQNISLRTEKIQRWIVMCTCHEQKFSHVCLALSCKLVVTTLCKKFTAELSCAHGRKKKFSTLSSVLYIN